MRRVFAGILFIVVLAFTSSACNDIEPASRPREKAVSDITHEVTYKVMGQGRAYVTYSGPNGEFLDDIVNLPWEKTITWRERPGQNARVSIHKRPDTKGTLKCSIYADGRFIETDTFKETVAGCVFWP